MAAWEKGGRCVAGDSEGATRGPSAATPASTGALPIMPASPLAAAAPAGVAGVAGVSPPPSKRGRSAGAALDTLRAALDAAAVDVLASMSAGRWVVGGRVARRVANRPIQRVAPPGRPRQSAPPGRRPPGARASLTFRPPSTRAAWVRDARFGRNAAARRPPRGWS